MSVIIVAKLSKTPPLSSAPPAPRDVQLPLLCSKLQLDAQQLHSNHMKVVTPTIKRQEMQRIALALLNSRGSRANVEREAGVSLTGPASC